MIYVDEQVWLFMHATRTPPPDLVALKHIIHYGLSLYSNSAHTLLSYTDDDWVVVRVLIVLLQDIVSSSSGALDNFHLPSPKVCL